MFDHAKNIMIGLFVVAAIVIVIFILLFIHPVVGDEGKVLRVRFANIDKINVGTRVSFGGKPVGEVVEIKEIINPSDPRVEKDGQVYVYELKLAVDSSINVYNTDEISVQTSGLLGEKSVNIAPYPPKEGEKLVIVNDKILYAEQVGSVEDTLKEIKSLSGLFKNALNGIIESVDDINNNKMWEKIAGTFKNLEDITGGLNKPQDWSEITDNIHTISQRAVKSWDNVDEALQNIVEASDAGKSIIENVKAGEGTIGKLLMKDDFYLRATSLMSKAQTTMNDINHYGVLFHLDKNWQRLRARRLNLLLKLNSPQEFRNYFNDEIDQINTSLSRVYMVLNKIEPYSTCSNIVKDFEFMKVFSELLKRVGDVEEELNMYNVQLQEYNVHETELLDCR